MPACARVYSFLFRIDAHSHDDARWDAAQDTAKGVDSKSILCVPIRNQLGSVIGVAELANKRRSSVVEQMNEEGTQLAHSSSQTMPAILSVRRSSLPGIDNINVTSASQLQRAEAECPPGAETSALHDVIQFDEDDIRLVEALSAQAGVVLENSTLQRSAVEQQNLLREVMHSLESLLITFDKEGKMVHVNHSGDSWLNIRWKGWMRRHYTDWLEHRNKLVSDAIGECLAKAQRACVYDYVFKSGITSAFVNLTLVPLRDFKGEPNGVVLVLEELKPLQRIVSTLTRYMPPERVNAYVSAAYDPQAKHMRGQVQRVCIVHLHVRASRTLGSTPFAARGHDPQLALKLMNECTAQIGKAILKEEARAHA
jgi:transcriptional regulator with PAS, ATPase and Fis domain